MIIVFSCSLSSFFREVSLLGTVGMLALYIPVILNTKQQKLNINLYVIKGHAVYSRHTWPHVYYSVFFLQPMTLRLFVCLFSTDFSN